jgi:hypothetical protein
MTTCSAPFNHTASGKQRDKEKADKKGGVEAAVPDDEFDTDDPFRCDRPRVESVRDLKPR